MTDSTTPEHLRFEVSDRGFKHLPPIHETYNGNVRVLESSAASEPCIWLNVTTQADQVHAHLTLEAAEQLSDQIRYLINHHYQRESVVDLPTTGLPEAHPFLGSEP